MVEVESPISSLYNCIFLSPKEKFERVLERALIKLNHAEEGENIYTKEGLVDLVPANGLNVAAANIFLKECRVKTREHGYQLNRIMLNNRVKDFVNGILASSCYQPSPFGINWREYWFPILIETAYSIIIIVGTIVGTIVLYQLCEHLHHKWGCQYLVNIFTLQCYVVKNSRSYLESYAYDIVYTTIVGIGVAGLRIFVIMRGKVESHLKVES